MIKKLSLLLAICFCLICVSFPFSLKAAEATNEAPLANAACVYNVENDTFLYAKNIDEFIYPAATVKLMVAILALEYYRNDLDQEIIVKEDWLAEVSGIRINLRRDEIVTAREMIYAVICGSANDAAIVLAYDMAGGQDGLAELMNERAEAMGMTHTHFTNPTGMHDPEMVTTVRDLTILASAARSYDTILSVSSYDKYEMPSTNKTGMRTIWNRNYYFASNVEYKYIWSVPEGLNYGYTDEAGYCLITSRKDNGLTNIVIVMGEPQAKEEHTFYAYSEASGLLKWCYQAYDYQKLLTTSDMVCEIPVSLSTKVDYVSLFPSETVELFLPVDLDFDTDIRYEWHLTEDHLTAPVSEGQVCGKLTIYFHDENLGEYDLITRNSVDRNNFLYVINLLKETTKTTGFRMILIVAFLGAILFVGYLLILRSVKKR